MSFEFSEIEKSPEKRALSESRVSSNVGEPVPRRDRKWKPDYESDEPDSELYDIENLQIEPTSQRKKYFLSIYQNHLFVSRSLTNFLRHFECVMF